MSITKKNAKNASKPIAKQKSVSRALIRRLPSRSTEQTAEAVEKDTRTPKRTKTTRKKDPTDALGNFISTIDIDKIDSDVDFESMDVEVKRMLKNVKNDVKKLVTEENFLRLCKSFDLTIRELMATMMERYPDTMGVTFMKSVVKPFVVGLIREKNEYSIGTYGFYNKPIFEYI